MPTRPRPLPAPAAYLAALAVTAAALAASALLSSGGRFLLAPLIGAVAVAVWLGGAGPALVSLVVGYVLATMVLSDRPLQEDPDGTEFVRVAVNVGVAALVIALLAQAVAGLVWAGGAAARIGTLETRVDEQRLVAERLARLEEQSLATRAAVERVERRLEAGR